MENTNAALQVKRFWDAYLRVTENAPVDLPCPEAWGFGDSPAMADELGDLVYRGVKTATCSLFWEYEVEGTQPPKAGDLSIILNGHGEPFCIIETVEVVVKPFEAVEAAFAAEEGEGDRSLAYWRDAHWRYFSRICAGIGRQPDANMPLVCERFRVIFRGENGGEHGETNSGG